MKTFQKLCLPLLASLALGLCSLGPNAGANTVVDFSDLTLPNATSQTQFAPNGITATGYYWDGPDPNGSTQPDGYGGTETVGQFTSGGLSFTNRSDITYPGVWEGFSYSNVVDTTTQGYTNQFASITGGGRYGPGSTYAVAYQGVYSPTITLPAPTTVLNMDVANTTYAYYSMLDGDSFGDTAFSSSDSFQLSIQGYDTNGQSTSGEPVVFDLASGTNILSSWSTVNLSGLGDDVKSLQFSLTSTQPYTPSYFALGDLNVVPEPSTLALLSVGALAALVAWRRGRSNCRK